jgi:hypothetical protein
MTSRLNTLLPRTDLKKTSGHSDDTTMTDFRHRYLSKLVRTYKQWLLGLLLPGGGERKHNRFARKRERLEPTPELTTDPIMCHWWLITSQPEP